jgi:hypothetical protein
MAKQAFPNQNTITTITDVHDNVIMEVRQEEYLVTESDGSISSYTHYRNITLVDGSTWSPLLLSARPPVYVGVCEICRNPSLFRRRTHGLVAMARAKLCVCGILCCPAHRRLLGNKWLCPGCAKTYRLKSIFRPLFFERREE